MVCIVVCDVHAVERQSLAIEINAPRSIASPTPVQLTVRHGHVRSGVIGVVTDGPHAEEGATSSSRFDIAAKLEGEPDELHVAKANLHDGSAS